MEILKEGVEIIEKLSYEEWIVKTKYGLHKIQPHNTLNSKGIPGAKTALDQHIYWSSRILERNPDIIITSIIKGFDDSVLFYDKYGDCQSTVKSLNRKGHNIKSAINKNLYFKNRVLEIHGDTYSYKDFIYKNYKQEFKVICKEHGEFKLSTGSHLKGVGCAKCAYSKNKGLNMTTVKRLSKADQMQPAYVYIIKLENEEEIFYKIGVTTNIKSRLYQFSPYKHTIIEVINLPLIEAVVEELKLHETHIKLKYKPKINFCGKTECYSKLIERNKNEN